MLEPGEDSLFFDPTPDLLVQYCTEHTAQVVDVKDPEGRGRVRVLVPGLLSVGKENWSDWVEMCGAPIGGTGKSQGDQGIWWPMIPTQAVMMKFVSGDPFAYSANPGPPCQKDEGKNQELIPKEAKNVAKATGDPRAATRIRVVKTEPGHTLLFDDRGKHELMSLVDWTGAGLFFIAPGKKEDEKEEEGDESKPRKGERRGTRTVFARTSAKPSELIEGGTALSGFLDLNGQGFLNVAQDGAGVTVYFATKENGQLGPSLILDAKEDRIILTAKETQLQILGKEGHIAVTRQIVKEIPEPIDVEKFISEVLEAVGQRFKEYDG